MANKFDSGRLPENVQPIRPVQKTMSIIRAKRASFIPYNLLAGEKRSGRLRKAHDGAGPKTLSPRLREPWDAGILKRAILAEVPPRVEHSPTEKGASWGKVVGVLPKENLGQPAV